MAAISARWRKRKLLWIVLISVSGIIPFLVLSNKHYKRPKSGLKSVVLVDEDFLYYNRVPKTGSENFAFLFKNLAAKNDFMHLRFGNPNLRSLNASQLNRHVKYLRNLRRKSDSLSYDRHVYFINFNSIDGGRNPVWFSNVRHPVEKFASRFYYARQTPILMKRKRNQLEALYKGDGDKVDALYRLWKNRSVENCVLESDFE